MLTSGLSELDLRNSRQDGIDAFLPKPFKPSEVLTAIETAVEVRGAAKGWA